MALLSIFCTTDNTCCIRACTLTLSFGVSFVFICKMMNEMLLCMKVWYYDVIVVDVSYFMVSIHEHVMCFVIVTFVDVVSLFWTCIVTILLLNIVILTL